MNPYLCNYLLWTLVKTFLGASIAKYAEQSLTAEHTVPGEGMKQFEWLKNWCM